jgi:DNA replication protein DnaC
VDDGLKTFDQAIGWTAGVVHCEKHGDQETHSFGHRPLVCPKCTGDAMLEQRKKDAEERRIQAEAEWKESIKESVPARYRDSRLADFSKDVSDKVSAWLKKCHESSGSLIIAGPVGTGKTHLATAIAKGLLLSRIGSDYVSQAAYLRQIRETWAKDSTRDESEVMAKYTRPRVLVLDDIGAARGNENDTMRLGELIAERYDAQKPSVFVSNLTPEQLKATVGDRSYDRMRDGATMLVLNGDSRRKPA